jgi:osmotically inducible lipoprotein OsmB
MKKILLALPLVAALTLTGCSGMNTTQQRELSGGAIGAAAGAGITAIAGGNPIWGAIGGAAVGVLGGYVYDRHEQGQ